MFVKCIECDHILEDEEYPVKDNELCDREFYVNVVVMNAAKDSLTSIGISTPSQLHNSTNPPCLSGLNPIKLLKPSIEPLCCIVP